MFDIPSDEQIEKVSISKECITDDEPPLITKSSKPQPQSQTHMSTETLAPGEYVADSAG